MGLLEAAISYRRRGWSVMPISPTTKTPLIKWKDLQTRLPDEEEIHQWWEEFPAANIGLITGRISGLAVIDVDPERGGNTEETLKEFPTGRVSKTGGGGNHLFYHLAPNTPPIPNRVNVRPGIDVRGEGGYVVLPPSRHASGRPYRWIEKGKPSRSIPGLLLVDQSTSSVRQNGRVHHSEPWVSELLKGGMKEGDGRDNAAARLAGYFINKGMPEDIIVEQLVAWDMRNEEPLGRKLIEQKVHSVMQTHQRRTVPDKPKFHIDQPQEAFGLLPLHQYMTQFGDQPVSWTIEGWLPEQTIAMAIAPPGTYKTWLELALAVSVASGRPFLGKYEVLAPGPVIVIQQEDYHGQMAERLACVVGSLFDFGADPASTDRFEYTAPPKLPIYLHPDRKFRFDENIVIEALAEKIEKIKPVLVIIDPLYSTGRIDDFGVGLVENMWPVKTLRDEFGCSFFLSHHTGKGKITTEREDLWGVQFLNAFMETGWQIRRKDQPDTAIIRRHFKVRKDTEEELIKFDISTEAPYKFDVTVRTPTSKDMEGPNILDAIQHLGPINQADLAVHLGVDKSTISRRLKKMVEGELVTKDEKGRYSHGIITEPPE
jgi:hypothetical protein